MVANHWLNDGMVTIHLHCHDFRRGKTQGSCFPDSFGGECSGTPRECQDCNRAIRCQEETGTRTPTQRCRCNGQFNSNGDGECGTKFNGGHFCYINQGDCSDGVRSAKTGLWWSYQACNVQQPRSREPKAIGHSSSLVQAIAGGTCITSCNNWPHSQCKVDFEFGNGGRRSATCIAPYTGSTNRFNQPQKFSNYPE